MSVINYGAKFVDDGLKCDECGSVNNFEVIGFCDGIDLFGKLLKCNECGNEVRQILAYDVKQCDKKIEL